MQTTTQNMAFAKLSPTAEASGVGFSEGTSYGGMQSLLANWPYEIPILNWNEVYWYLNALQSLFWLCMHIVFVNLEFFTYF